MPSAWSDQQLILGERWLHPGTRCARFTDLFERQPAAPFPQQQRLTAETRATAAAAVAPI